MKKIVAPSPIPIKKSASSLASSSSSKVLEEEPRNQQQSSAAATLRRERVSEREPVAPLFSIVEEGYGDFEKGK